MLEFSYTPPTIHLLEQSLETLSQSDATVALILVAEDRKGFFLGEAQSPELQLQEQLNQGSVIHRVEGGQWQWIGFLPAVLESEALLYKKLRTVVSQIGPIRAEHVAIHLYGFEPEAGALIADAALGVLLSQRVTLPSYKSAPKEQWPLSRVSLSPALAIDTARITAEVEGNALARCLSALPSSELTAREYRRFVRQLAQQEGWECHDYDQVQLAERGAGAFLAVARGADDDQGAIVRLRHRVSDKRGRLALVGKGICHDSGGYNLKVGGSMYGMHLDMGGSAVALGTLLAITRAGLPYGVDCWLAIAENHIGPRAYRPGDIVTAINGKTIEVVDTDAEGRMVLADTLTMAAENTPDLLIDYATLTGACKRALGSRYSGVFTNREAWLVPLIEVGRRCGERIWPFPLDEDYDETLESEWADLLQCAPGASCDHIDAARFLSHFVPAQTPWLHLDLSGFRHKGGQGIVTGEITGFGVRLTLALLADGRFLPKTRKQGR